MARREGCGPMGITVRRESVRVRMMARSPEDSFTTRSIVGRAEGSDVSKRIAAGVAPTLMGLSMRRLEMSTGMTRLAALSATYILPESALMRALVGAEPRSI